MGLPPGTLLYPSINLISLYPSFKPILEVKSLQNNKSQNQTKKESDFLILQYQKLIETNRGPPTTFIKITLLYDPQLTLAELYTPNLAVF